MDFGAFFFLATLEGLVQAAILTLTALGLSLVFGVMRIVNVAHGQFFMMGAVMTWWVAALFGKSPVLAFFAALILSPIAVGIVALASERLILRRLNYSPEGTIVATIGLLYIIQELTLTLYGPDARPVEPPFYFNVQFPWFGYSGYKLFVIAIAVVLQIATWFAVKRMKVGLVMRATQFDGDTAKAFGINVGNVYTQVFVLGGMLAAIAGVLIVPVQQAHYLMGLDPLLLSFIAVIVGGLGSIQGTVVAAILIGLSNGILSVFFSPTIAKIVAMLFVAFVLVLKPDGLFGAKEARA